MTDTSQRRGECLTPRKKVAIYRNTYRAEHIAPGYNGYLHFAVTISIGAGSWLACGVCIPRTMTRP